MRHRLSRTILGAMAIALVVGGCTDTQAGVPSPSPGPTTLTSQADSQHGAPLVANPLDTGKVLSQPCSALTSSQLTNLGLPAQGKPDTAGAIATYVGPSCDWQNSATAQSLSLAFVTGNKNGLADFYRAHKDGRYPGYWIETTVDGYPAVFMDSKDSRESGYCGLSVGISDALVFTARVQSNLGAQSCDQAKQAAALVLTTLRTGG